MEISRENEYEIIIEENVLKIILLDKKHDYQTLLLCERVAYKIRDYDLDPKRPQLKKF